MKLTVVVQDGGKHQRPALPSEWTREMNASSPTHAEQTQQQTQSPTNQTQPAQTRIMSPARERRDAQLLTGGTLPPGLCFCFCVLYCFVLYSVCWILGFSVSLMLS